MRATDWSLYVIVGSRDVGGRSILDVVRAAIRGGATVVQLREKEATTYEIIRVGQAVHEITRAAGVPLIVNDHVDVALSIGAEGVHVGPDDMPVPLARRLLGPEGLLGVSAGTVMEARRAERDGADYLGVGDIYGTPSKPDAGAPIGVVGLAEIVRTVSIPVVGIGGITPGNAAAVIQAGAVGVAVLSAVAGSADPEAAARLLRRIVRGG